MAKTLRRGTRLGKYRLERLIDRGSFAQVWKARDMVEARIVALKVAHAEVVGDWGRKEIEKEARIVSSLDHPNIVAVRNADWVEGRFVIASDLAVANLRSTRALAASVRWRSASCGTSRRGSHTRTSDA